MQFVHRTPEGDKELDLRVNDSTASVEELVKALSDGEAPPTSGLRIGSHFVAAGLGLLEAGLHDGDVVEIAPGRERRAAGQEPALLLHVIGGPDAGGSFPMAPGSCTLGRSPAADIVIRHPTVSRRHCTIDVTAGGRATLTNLSETAGVWIYGVPATVPTVVSEGDVIDLGDVQVTFRRPSTEDRPAGVDPFRHAGTGATILFNRPPQADPLAAAPALIVPTEPTFQGKPVFSVASIVSPIVFGAVMVVMVGNPMYAMFSLLAPLMVVGNWFETKRRNNIGVGEDRNRD